MSNIDALKKLAKKVCSTVSDEDIKNIATIDGAISLIAEKFDGKPAEQPQTVNAAEQNAQAVSPQQSQEESQAQAASIFPKFPNASI